MADTLPLVAANDLKLLTAVTCHERQRLATLPWRGREGLLAEAEETGRAMEAGWLAGLDDGGALRDNWREEIPLRIP